MGEKKWPPPGFPIVEGLHKLTKSWALTLPEPFARRIEDGSLVLWRPGLTFWISAWNNDHQQSRSDRLEAIKRSASSRRFDVSERVGDRFSRYTYRLVDQSEDGSVELLHGYVVSETGHLQVAAYFDDLTDQGVARGVLESIDAPDAA